MVDEAREIAAGIAGGDLFSDRWRNSREDEAPTP
jgi:hypothetical protein